MRIRQFNQYFLLQFGHISDPAVFFSQEYLADLNLLPVKYRLSDYALKVPLIGSKDAAVYQLGKKQSQFQ